MVLLKEHHSDVYAGELILPLPSLLAKCMHSLIPCAPPLVRSRNMQHAVDHGHEHARKCISEGSIGGAEQSNALMKELMHW